MTFRDREKKRLEPLKSQLFSEDACASGMYRGKRRSFCLHEAHAPENIHFGVRDAALEYFDERGIGWHDGKGKGPSNHLCCSQSCCVNFWFPFARAPQELADVLRGLGYDVAEMLPVETDCALADGTRPFVAFEWIGERNYLGELSRGKVAPDLGRTRGAGFTSLDFLVRFRRTDASVQVVAGEWKYTESYSPGVSLRISRSGRDRLTDIYDGHLDRPGCQIVAKVEREALFFDPFDQLMRQQLLCSAMERRGEMGADIVSLLHVAPRANGELMNRVTSSELDGFGTDIHEVWASIAAADRFTGVATEDLLPLVCANTPMRETAEYLERRYGCMA